LAEGKICSFNLISKHEKYFIIILKRKKIHDRIFSFEINECKKNCINQGQVFIWLKYTKIKNKKGNNKDKQKIHL
jgi:hypothetical protein